MKNILIFVAIIIIFLQNSYGWEGIGVNIGGGIYLDEPSYKASTNKMETIIAVEIPLVESNITEIELALINYWKKNITYLVPTYGLRIYIFEYQSLIRPSFHIGATSLPIVSWSVGTACDCRLYRNVHILLSSLLLFDAIRKLTGDDIPPSFSNISFKYYFK